jgi:hypothetical protein
MAVYLKPNFPNKIEPLYIINPNRLPAINNRQKPGNSCETRFLDGRRESAGAGKAKERYRRPASPQHRTTPPPVCYNNMLALTKDNSG